METVEQKNKRKIREFKETIALKSIDEKTSLLKILEGHIRKNIFPNPDRKILINEKVKVLSEIIYNPIVIIENENDEDIQSDFDYKICVKFIHIRNSARKRDKEFNLTISEVRKLLKRKTCYYTGIILSEPNELTQIDTDRTFDRIDNNQGYLIGNVVACSKFANNLKNILFEKEDGLALGKLDLVKKLIEKL